MNIPIKSVNNWNEKFEQERLLDGQPQLIVDRPAYLLPMLPSSDMRTKEIK